MQFFVTETQLLKWGKHEVIQYNAETTCDHMYNVSQNVLNLQIHRSETAKHLTRYSLTGASHYLMIGVENCDFPLLSSSRHTHEGSQSFSGPFFYIHDKSLSTLTCIPINSRSDAQTRTDTLVTVSRIHSQ